MELNVKTQIFIKTKKELKIKKPPGGRREKTLASDWQSDAWASDAPTLSIFPATRNTSKAA